MILFLLGIICAIIVFRPTPTPVPLPIPNERQPSLPPAVSYIPSQALRLPGNVTKGSLSYQPIDKDEASTISATFTLRQGDSITTQKDSTANFSSEGVSFSVLESTSLTASSLLPSSILFSLSEGKITLTTITPISLRVGFSLLRIASGSAIINNLPGEAISLAVLQGSASAAFLDADNETQVYEITKGKTLTIDPVTQTARIK